MHQHALVTVIAPLRADRVAAARDLIEHSLGNPAAAHVATALDGAGIHFASLHALAETGGEKAHLVLEFSADGEDDDAVGRIATRLNGELVDIFALAEDWRAGTGLEAYLLLHKVRPGTGWFSQPGLCFAGTPGMRVDAIRNEAALARHVTGLVSAPGKPATPLARLEAVRKKLRSQPDWAWVFDARPDDIPQPGNEPGTIRKVGLLAASFARLYLWPFAILALLAVLYCVWQSDTLTDAICTLLKGLGWALLALVLGTGGVLLLVFLSLRSLEKKDIPHNRTIADAELEAILARENHLAHNHMVSLTSRKPGLTRAITLRLAFWIVGTLTANNGRPGHLGEIGTIHFARWVTLPGSRDLVFFSNYGGSWESYLEDFITKANEGLTAVWSNTIGFPRTRNLIKKGATDGERFKRFARESMVRTSFWFSAYPDLTTSNIRTNAKIRRGLVSAKTENEARDWLSLMGAEQQVEHELELDQVQSLILGGLGFLPAGTCLLVDLPAEVLAARRWLKAITPTLGFGDGRHEGQDAMATLALSVGGLARLGLERKARDAFPAPFRFGMTGPGRDRLLGDVGPNGAQHWWWGASPPDAALLVYGRTPADAKKLCAELENAIAASGATLVHRIPLKDVPPEPADRREPFGFLDGISQPNIRGTYRARRNPDPRQRVEPGEFIIGYRDNRGNVPPEPEGGLARNGSFLVIRQLEQHVEAFADYCRQQAQKTGLSQELIGAKMVGRWPDGAPLVRWPDKPSPYGPDPDNDFLFGTEDPDGVRCPFGAHIRRANPRESMTPGSDVQLSITNRHRILRVGRLYAEEKGQNPGLLFMCFNADLERQFEFIQQTWLISPSFHGLDGEADPILGLTPHYTIPGADGPTRLAALPQFVTMRGGGYFFVPGKAMIAHLSDDRPQMALI